MMKIPGLRHCALFAVLALGSLSVAKADLLGFDFVNPSNDGNLAEISGTLDNVTGELTVTFIARSGMFFNDENEFDFNVGDPSRGQVIEQQAQNVVFLDPIETVSNAPTVTITDGPSDTSNYEGSVIGWQSGDTLITCGPILEQNCADQNFGFESGVFSFDSGGFVGTIATSAILGGGSQIQSAPEPGYGIPLALLLAGFLLVTAYKRRALLQKL